MGKNIKIGLFIAVFSILAACTKVQKPVMHPKDINRTVDSIVKTKLSDIRTQATDDLDHRMAIEVKAKVDSILAAQQNKSNASAKPDTAKFAPAPSVHALTGRRDTTHK